VSATECSASDSMAAEPVIEAATYFDTPQSARWPCQTRYSGPLRLIGNVLEWHLLDDLVEVGLGLHIVERCRPDQRV
jgi:hypothetical protein